MRRLAVGVMVICAMISVMATAQKDPTRPSTYRSLSSEIGTQVDTTGLAQRNRHHFVQGGRSRLVSKLSSYLIAGCWIQAPGGDRSEGARLPPLPPSARGRGVPAC